MVRSSSQPSYRSETLATPHAAAPARVAVLVVSPDDAVWTPLAAAAKGRDAHQFDSVAELVSQWDSSRAAVVLVDGRGDAALEPAIHELLRHSTALVPVAIVDEASRDAAAALERKRSLFDHLLLPVDTGTARTVLDRAADEAAARLSLVAGEVALAAAGAGAPGRSRPRGLVLALAGAAVLVAAAAGWWLTRPAGPAPAAGPAAPKVAPIAAVPAEPAVKPAASAPAEELEAQLERARAAMRDKRYIDPPSDNALAHYKTVLDLDPQNGEARQGLDRITELLIARAGSAMQSKDYASALRALESARSLKPDHPRLAALDQQVNQHLKELSATQVTAALQANAFARAATLLAQAEKTGAMPADQIAQLRAEAQRREAAAQLTEVARVAQVRISQGRLLDPPNDSARFYLKQLQDHPSPALADALARLNDAYARRLGGDARAAIGRGAWADADALIGELRTTNGGASLAQAQALQKDLDRARDQLKTRATEAAEAKAAADAARETSAAAAAATAAPPPPAAPAAPVAVTAPKLLTALAPDYPQRAAAAGVEGWVEVQFDVTVTGKAENVRVLGAQPKGVFDAAALGAIRKARFAPARTADGAPIVQASTLKLRFALDERR
jgi:TonB family protein